MQTTVMISSNGGRCSVDDSRDTQWCIVIIMNIVAIGAVRVKSIVLCTTTPLQFLIIVAENVTFVLLSSLGCHEEVFCWDLEMQVLQENCCWGSICLQVRVFYRNVFNGVGNIVGYEFCRNATAYRKIHV